MQLISETCVGGVARLARAVTDPARMPPSEPFAPPPSDRVLVIAEDPLARAGLTRILEGEGVEVVTAVHSPEQAREAWARADALVWDLGTRGKWPGRLEPGAPPALALVEDEAMAREVLARGGSGAVLREVDGRTLVAALRSVARGLVVQERTFASLRPDPLPALGRGGDFTPREREVLTLLARGLSNRLIAVELRISTHTAKFHVNAVMQKLGVVRRTEAVVRAARLGLVVL